MLNIPFYALNFQEDFDEIIEYFADEYVKGRTPNPCVVCNDRLKFGKTGRSTPTPLGRSTSRPGITPASPNATTAA